MKKICAWLAVATLVMVLAPSAARSQASEPLKPYVTLVLDTSGSMELPTGSGAPSCGGPDTRLNHAKCAINRIVNSYGDIVFGLGRFRETTGGTFTSSCDANGNIDGNPGASLPVASGGDQCTTQGIYCGDCEEDIGLNRTCTQNAQCWSGSCVNGRCGPGYGSCTTADREFELLSPLVDGNNQNAGFLTDGACGTCAMSTTSSSSNEIWGVSPYTFTPLAAVLNGAKLYWRGQETASDGTTTIWPSSSAGFAPIANDPTSTSFLPQGCNPSPTCTTNCCASQCRPYITILLTDGAETCTTFSNTTTAAASLLTTDVAGRRYRVETKPIGFGIAPGDSQIEGIAHAGGEPNIAGNQGYYASDEAGLQLAISTILADAIRTESCNNLDDDCDTQIDETFPGKAALCSNGRSGKCRVAGANVCRTDGTGLACDAGQAACSGLTAGQACSVVNEAAATVTGTCQPASGGLAGLVCQPTAAPSEVPFGCNQIDDDCDGRIDEGVGNCGCIVTGETCNNMDEDCDGQIDEDLTRPCGSGVCQGVETCTAGAWGGCTAPTAGTEICNGVDDDCDGNADGFTEACSNLSNGFPAMDPLNNPGADHTPNSGCEALGAQCICNPGVRTCPLNGAGTFGACVNEVVPQLEICNNLDDDCDGLVDEAPPSTCSTSADCAGTPLTPTCDNPSMMANMGTCVPPDCSTNCGVGQLVCVGGMQVCNAVAAASDDSCDGADDDCDGMIDEDWVCDDPPNCACDAGPSVCGGVQSCQNGAELCTGDPVAQESCNCDDDDCDNAVDEGALCGAGATCTNCQCAFACSPGEFPCPAGKKCEGGFCIADPCFGVTCPAVGGDKQVCRGVNNAPVCVSACDPAVITCPSPLICFTPTGECKPNDCTTFPAMCTATENCINGACVSNPCDGVSCPTSEYCVGGQCFGSCADVECADGERCRMGMCVTDPCGGPCPSGQACNDSTGQCVSNPCQFVTCPGGQYCNPNNAGMCEDDPCVGTTCPNEGEVCLGGTCFDPLDFLPDAGVEERVTTGGGGGCSTGGAGGSGGALLLGLTILALVVRRRRVGGAA